MPRRWRRRCAGGPTAPPTGAKSGARWDGGRCHGAAGGAVICRYRRTAGFFFLIGIRNKEDNRQRRPMYGMGFNEIIFSEDFKVLIAIFINNNVLLDSYMNTSV